MKLLLAISILTLSTPALAQKADATAAFQHGQQLKKEGKTAEACAAFELSMKLDVQRGTQYNLALCYLELGRTASAWAELNELANVDTNVARRDDAAKRAKELRAKLTNVVVELAERDQVVVTRDGVDITALVGTPTPVDPGVHHYAAHAPNRRDWTSDVDVKGEGATITVSVPKLAAPEVAAPQPPPAPPPHQEPPPPIEPPAHPGRGRRIAGITIGVVGVAGMTVGAIYGVRAMSRGDDARRLCGGSLDTCAGDPLAAQHALDLGRDAARISNIGFIAGGVLAATGVILYVTAPHGLAATPVAGPDGVGMTFAGRF